MVAADPPKVRGVNSNHGTPHMGGFRKAEFFLLDLFGSVGSCRG